ncbi:hypothetical protein ANN_16640 [Periplaneta americana]|uniref:Uncharacterized protein n=1 Tax=Periplaneta americana TaxID=6978 RepID=A0ABQ8SSA6_PERAM|nr:hypothetical protein ANN_16640 [Periplaneta americana]
MAGLCEGGIEPPGSLKASNPYSLYGERRSLPPALRTASCPWFSRIFPRELIVTDTSTRVTTSWCSG